MSHSKKSYIPRKSDRLSRAFLDHMHLHAILSSASPVPLAHVRGGGHESTSIDLAQFRVGFDWVDDSLTGMNPTAYRYLPDCPKPLFHLLPPSPSHSTRACMVNMATCVQLRFLAMLGYQYGLVQLRRNSIHASSRQSTKARAL